MLEQIICNFMKPLESLVHTVRYIDHGGKSALDCWTTTCRHCRTQAGSGDRYDIGRGYTLAPATGGIPLSAYSRDRRLSSVSKRLPHGPHQCRSPSEGMVTSDPVLQRSSAGLLGLCRVTVGGVASRSYCCCRKRSTMTDAYQRFRRSHCISRIWRKLSC